MIEEAPKYLRDRYNSLRNYAWHSFFPKDTYKNKIKRFNTKKEKREFNKKANEIVDEAGAILTIFFMNYFFKEGTRTAIEAVDIFEELNINGFKIGSTTFRERNENVMMGENLSKALREELPDNLVKIIDQKNHPHEIIELFKERIDEL